LKKRRGFNWALSSVGLERSPHERLRVGSNPTVPTDARVEELVYSTGLKLVARKGLRVRIPPLVPLKQGRCEMELTTAAVDAIMKDCLFLDTEEIEEERIINVEMITCTFGFDKEQIDRHKEDLGYTEAELE
jgi:hypothetical protein